jgi:hypothetical protein
MVIFIKHSCRLITDTHRILKFEVGLALAFNRCREKNGKAKRNHQAIAISDVGYSDIHHNAICIFLHIHSMILSCCSDPWKNLDDISSLDHPVISLSYMI